MIPRSPMRSTIVLLLLMTFALKSDGFAVVTTTTTSRCETSTRTFLAPIGSHCKTKLPSVHTPKNRSPKMPEPALQQVFRKGAEPMLRVFASLGIALLLMTTTPADAAMSGGRMGGSTASSPSYLRSHSSMSSSPSRSRSYSSSSGSRSYPSPSYSRHSRSHSSMSSSPSRSRSYSSPSYSRHYSLPSRSPPYSPPSPSYSSPSYSSASYTPSYSHSSTATVDYDDDGSDSAAGALVNILGIIVTGLFQAIRSFLDGISRKFSSGLETLKSIFSRGDEEVSAWGPGTSVVVTSLAFEVPNRDDSSNILSKLVHLSETAQTETRTGLQALTADVALDLLRATKSGSLRGAYAETKHFKSVEQSTRQFQEKSVLERSKFERETVSKYGGVDSGIGQLSPTKEWSDNATMAVVTMILHVRGKSLLQPRAWTSTSQVRKLLSKIASVVAPSSTKTADNDCLQDVEILWTPADRSETLTTSDVVADYPELRTLC